MIKHLLSVQNCTLEIDRGGWDIYIRSRVSVCARVFFGQAANHLASLFFDGPMILYTHGGREDTLQLDGVAKYKFT